MTATSPGAGQELLGLVMSANEKAARALKRQIRRAPIEDKVSIASSLGYPADMPTDALDMVLLAHAKHQQQLCAAAPGAAPVGVPSGPASAPPGGIISSAPGKGGAPRGRAGAGEHAADGGVAAQLVEMGFEPRLASAFRDSGLLALLVHQVPSPPARPAALPGLLARATERRAGSSL